VEVDDPKAGEVTHPYTENPNQTISATNGVTSLYRKMGKGHIPLVSLQDCRGNLDNWEPALVDNLAAGRRVITFDNCRRRRQQGNNDPHCRADGP
jgi:hypothetical protein